MQRIHWITLNLFTASAMLFAQDSQTSAPQNGGWRRAGETAAPVASTPSTPSTTSTMDQDQTQPVARTDAYGQPVTVQADNQQAPVDGQAAPAPMQRTDRIQNDRPPAAVPHYGLPSSVTIKAGTFVNARVNQELSSDHSQVGDVFSATLAEPVVVDGVVVAQRGQTVMGRVTEAIKSGKAQGVSHLGLQLTGINLADGTQAANQSHVVAGNGAAGAGAAATAGPAGVLLTRSHPTIVYPQTQLTFQLDTPVTVDLARAPQAFRFVGPDDYNRNTTTTTAVRRAPSTVYGGPGYYGYAPYYGYGFGYGYPYYGYGPGFGFGLRIGGGGFRRFR
jgi:hypothetical protein